MRTLFLLRGAPGSGKSTWVNRNNLEPYTLCADQIRTLIFVMMVLGRLAYTKFHGTYHPCEGCRFQPVVKIYYNADGKRIEEKYIVFKECVNLPFYKF